MSALAKPLSTPPSPAPQSEWNIEAVRVDFPILSTRVYNRPLIYFDNAATTQKPLVVVDAISNYYLYGNANIHRGVHYLSEKATDAFETVRHQVQTFIGARSANEIVFVRGATEGLNLLAATLGRTRVKSGDEILISIMEHHSNIVPWQLLCEQTGARLVVIPMHANGELDQAAFEKLLTPRTRILALTHVSNSIGSINPVKHMIQLAHRQNTVVILDAAQSVAHMPIDVQDLDCDFMVLSGHKLYGPTGIGVLYGKGSLLDSLPPYQSGGDMISSVRIEKSTFHKAPQKFEAGTPHIAGVLGLGAALDYLTRLGMAAIATYENSLLAYATQVLTGIPHLRIIGQAREKSGIISFTIDDVHPHDIGTILDRSGIAIRAGHHCTMPLWESLGIVATARVSLGLYNTPGEIDHLAETLNGVRKVMGL